MIKPVNNSGMDMPVSTNEKTALKKESKNEATAKQEAYIVDIGNTNEKKATYDRPGAVKVDIRKIEQLKKDADDALRPLRQMVEELLKKQGMTFRDANLKPNEGEMVEIDEQTKAEAQRLISEDGEYGIENTANRLFEFAIAISGGDKTKLDELKLAIMQGYMAAEKAFGGELPEICKKTLERTMEKLDQWAKSE